MTDSQTRYTIVKDDIANNNYELNLPDEQAATACIAVIGGIVYEGESFKTLRLFKSKSLAEKYIVELLSEESIYTYVQVQLHEIIAGGKL